MYTEYAHRKCMFTFIFNSTATMYYDMMVLSFLFDLLCNFFLPQLQQLPYTFVVVHTYIVQTDRQTDSEPQQKHHFQQTDDFMCKFLKRSFYYYISLAEGFLIVYLLLFPHHLLLRSISLSIYLSVYLLTHSCLLHCTRCNTIRNPFACNKRFA